MNIRLPNEFIYRNGKSYAEVSKGKLYIKGNVNYEDIMYAISYEITGDDICYYCKGYITSKKRTLDHMYPRVWGGISIPNNLVPCCKKCNQEKSEMTYKQYEKYRKTPYKNREEYYKKCIKENKKKLEEGKYVLPRKWVIEYDISEIVEYMQFEMLNRKGVDKLEEYYETRKQYPHPIIISGNGWVFKGMHILEHAKRHRNKKVPAIVLENVIVVNNSL